MSEYKFFKIPAASGTEQEQELNRFLRGHRVLQVHRDFVAAGADSFWALTVEYLSATALPGDGVAGAVRARVDYKEILSAEDFELFSRLRDVRKQLAEKESVPPYTIFTNEQLAEIVRKKVSSASALKEIAGVGEARALKYGSEFLPSVTEFVEKSQRDEPKRKSDASSP